MSDLIIRVLDETDASAFQALRLRGLEEFPAAFASSYEEECDIAIDAVGARLNDRANGAVLGAFTAGSLIAVMGVRRERHRKMMHRALLWGVFVSREGRGYGVGHALGRAALDYAKSQLKCRQVILGVGVSNVAAIALYKRLGFEAFGIEQDYLFIDGEYLDEMHMIHFLEGTRSRA